MSKRGKKQLFWKIYRISTTILFSIIIFVWVFLWLFLDSYEKGTPETKMYQVIEMFNKQKYSTISKYISFESEFYNNKDYIKYIKEKINGDKYEYIKKSGLYKESEPVYSIINNRNEEVCIVYLKKEGKKGLFNQKIWDIKKIDNLITQTNDIKVIIPSNKELYINDIKVSTKYIKDNNYIRDEFKSTGDTSILEKESLYEIKNILFDSKVTVENKELINNENIYKYVYPENKELLNSLNDRLNNIVTGYTKYVSNEVNFGSISNYIYKGSHAYKFLSTVSGTNIWNGNHTPCIITDIKYESIEVYNENLIKVEVSYHYSFKVGSNEKSFDPELKLYLYKSNGNWYLIDLTT